MLHSWQWKTTPVAFLLFQIGSGADRIAPRGFFCRGKAISSSRTTLAGNMDRSSSEVDVPDEEAQHSQQVVRVGSFLPENAAMNTGESSAEVEVTAGSRC